MTWKAAILTCLMGTAIVAAGCDWMPGKPTEADKPVIKSTITDFEILWTNQCSGCHGADGRWGPARPLNDPLYLAIAGKEYVTRVITDGVPNSLMPPYAQHNGGSMTDEQIKDVVDGMWEHWSNPGRHQEHDDAGNERQARQSKSRAKDSSPPIAAIAMAKDGNGGKAGSVVEPHLPVACQ